MSNTSEILARMNALGNLQEAELPAHGTAPADVTKQGKYKGSEQLKRPLDVTKNKEAIDTSKGEKAANATPDDDDKGAEDAIFKGQGVSQSLSTDGEEVKAKIKESVDSLQLDLDAMRNFLETHSDDQDFVAEALEIFESALRHALAVQTEKMAAAAEQAIQVAIEDEVTVLESQVDDYLNLAIMEWAEDNRLAIEEGIRTNVTESFMSDLVGLFESYNVTLPSESIDLYEHSINVGEQILNENEKLQARLKAVEAERDSVHKALVIEAFIEDNRLTRSDAERVRTLAESIAYKNMADFERKLNTINESYRPSRASHESLVESTRSQRRMRRAPISESVDSDGLAIQESRESYGDPTVSALASTFRALK